MDQLFRGVRPSDVVLALLVSALGVLLMLENISGAETDLRVDSTSWLLVPVFLATTVPVLWRRRSALVVTLVSLAAMAAHVAAFGWLVRCGAGLPLAFVLAFAAGRFVAERNQSAITLLLTVGVQALVLVRDSAAGIEILPVTALIAVALWAIGRFVTARTSSSADARVADAVPVASLR